MNNTFTIPAPLQINMDDVGWWCGRNDNNIGGPSRTAMCRPHTVSDYQAISDLGKALNTKITCGLVMGEWDMDNRLSKDILHFSHFGKNWNNAAYRNADDMQKAAEILHSPYIEIAAHALYHGYYMPGVDCADISDFYYRKNDIYHSVPEDEIRNRLDHFFRLCKEHGINTRIETFIPPSYVYRENELTSILKDYGFKFCGTIFESIPRAYSEPYEVPDSVFIENDIITVDRKYNLVHWANIDCDFDNIEEKSFGIFGLHWPNILNADPKKHGETLKKLLPYFRRCENTFGIVMSRNMAFAATQELYKKYTKTLMQNSSIILDLSEVPYATGRLSSFFVSLKKKPANFEGCTLGEIREKDGFSNFEIFPLGDIVKIRFDKK